MIKSLPIEENPREKAIVNGIESLSNVELLALVLRTGNKDESVVQLAQRLLKEIGGISQLSHICYADLIALKGIKKAKAIELLSVIEMSKRLKQKESHESLLSPRDIYDYVKNEMMMLKQEHFVVLCLDIRNRVIKKKEVFKEAIGVSSAKMILLHNHPSGDASPSQEDLYLTDQFVKLGEMMAIEIMDHIIVGWNQFYSIKAKQLYYDNHD